MLVSESTLTIINSTVSIKKEKILEDIQDELTFTALFGNGDRKNVTSDITIQKINGSAPTTSNYDTSNDTTVLLEYTFGYTTKTVEVVYKRENS